jgi:hypothetical protein
MGFLATYEVFLPGGSRSGDGADALPRVLCVLGLTFFFIVGSGHRVSPYADGRCTALMHVSAYR